MSSTMRILSTSQSAKKSATSPSVASKDKFPRWTVYGGLDGRGSSSRNEKPRSVPGHEYAAGFGVTGNVYRL